MSEPEKNTAGGGAQHGDGNPPANAKEKGKEKILDPQDPRIIAALAQRDAEQGPSHLGKLNTEFRPRPFGELSENLGIEPQTVRTHSYVRGGESSATAAAAATEEEPPKVYETKAARDQRKAEEILRVLSKD